MKDLVDLRDIHHQVLGDCGECFGRAHPHGNVPGEILPQKFDIGYPLCILPYQSMEPIDVLVDGGFRVILEQNPSPTYRLCRVDEHPLSFDIPFLLCLLGDLVLVVQDELLLGRILLAVRIDRVEASPDSLCHDFPQRCRSIKFGCMMFVVHPCEYLLGAKQKLLRKDSTYPVEGNGVIVFDQLGVDPRWQSFRDIVFVRLCRSNWLRRCRVGGRCSLEGSLVLVSSMSAQHQPLCLQGIFFGVSG